MRMNWIIPPPWSYPPPVPYHTPPLSLMLRVIWSGAQTTERLVSSCRKYVVQLKSVRPVQLPWFFFWLINDYLATWNIEIYVNISWLYPMTHFADIPTLHDHRLRRRLVCWSRVFRPQPLRRRQTIYGARARYYCSLQSFLLKKFFK